MCLTTLNFIFNYNQRTLNLPIKVTHLTHVIHYYQHCLNYFISGRHTNLISKSDWTFWFVLHFGNLMWPTVSLCICLIWPQPQVRTVPHASLVSLNLYLGKGEGGSISYMYIYICFFIVCFTTCYHQR